MTNDTFLRACRGEPTTHTPVWFMRQAGRSLPGYRALRERYDVLTLTQTPELAAQVSLEPVTLHNVDAAILFADIMLLPIAMGIDVKIIDTIGPVIEKPINTPEDISMLKPFLPEKVVFLQKTIRILRGELTVPLIGFAGAPFTLASYLIEGKPSRTWHKTKQFMFQHPVAWHNLMSTLSEATIQYLQTQTEAGAQALQLFDSWVGCLSPTDYQTFVLPHMRHIFEGVKHCNVPRIHFATNTAGILDDFSDVDCEVIGLDWRTQLSHARKVVGNKSIQGNLDPAILLADWDTAKMQINNTLQSAGSKTGYIFNLGHGVLPETPEIMLKKTVDYVHAAQ